MSYVVLAKWVAREGRAEEVARTIADLVPPSRSEPGCIVYEPMRIIDDEHTFLLYEVYLDEEAYKAHGASEHFQRIAVERGFPLLERRERMFAEPLSSD